MECLASPILAGGHRRLPSSLACVSPAKLHSISLSVRKQRSVTRVTSAAAAISSPPKEVEPTEVESGGIRTLPFSTSLEDGRARLVSSIGSLAPPRSSNGVLRFQVPISSNVNALDWLYSQPDGSELLPQFYYSSRKCQHDLKFADVSTNVACIGSALTFRGTAAFSPKDWESIHSFLPKKSPVRAYGAMRFNPNREPSAEWEPFGAFYFFIPQVELCESRDSSVILAANLAWGEDVPFQTAVDALLSTLRKVSGQVTPVSSYVQTGSALRHYTPDEEWWRPELSRVVEILEDDQKVVMARRTELEVAERINPLSILSCFQKNDPSSYQFCLRLPDGNCFFGNTPEQLFARNGGTVTSDAVAGTRHRGATIDEDIALRQDLLQSPKDRIEFEVAESRIKSCLQNVCDNLQTPIKGSILKQQRVQHIHTLYTGELKENYEECDVLGAVYPASYAKKAPITSDLFDRGMYSGPVGWFSSEGAEFAVALRSALLHPFRDNSESTSISVYAGVGVVKGSTAEAEWRELNLKTSQFDMLMQPSSLS